MYGFYISEYAYKEEEFLREASSRTDIRYDCTRSTSFSTYPTHICTECGDGIYNSATEACDDGNTDDTDDCHNNCTISVTATCPTH